MSVVSKERPRFLDVYHRTKSGERPVLPKSWLSVLRSFLSKSAIVGPASLRHPHVLPSPTARGLLASMASPFPCFIVSTHRSPMLSGLNTLLCGSWDPDRGNQRPFFWLRHLALSPAAQAFQVQALGRLFWEQARVWPRLLKVSGTVYVSNVF